MGARPRLKVIGCGLTGVVVMTTDIVPVGGTTGLCHSSIAAIDEAAAWYRLNRATCEHPIIPALKLRFGLTSAEAVYAVRAASA